MIFFKKYGKIILFDALALLCFIGVVLFGWLPGPGGVPLFLLGLSLLAANHEWAERWLETAKHKGVTIKKTLFPDKAWVRNIYDLATVILFFTGVFGLFSNTNRLISAAFTILMTGSLFIFLFNRDRFDKIAAFYKKKMKR
ncbi:MAG: hypothetical protein M3Q36_04245 [bacterium]|nr:hypothetical protein [bacterium]